MEQQDITGFAKSIIETDQFERLRKITQYGLISKLDPTANTTRYDHCIGVYKNGKLMLDALQENTKDLVIPTFLRRCLEIAALLHDAGHGPFSHQWEDFTDKKYKHEPNADAIVDQIFTSANLQTWIVEEDPQYGNSKDLIKAFLNSSNSDCLKDKKFLFLFEIVNNKLCGLDVDKWDYLQRDYEHANKFLPEDIKARMKTAIKFDDVFLKARVSDNREHIEYRYEDFEKIYNIYYARQMFYIYFYKMPETVCLDQMAKQIIIDNRDKLTIDGMNILEIGSENVDKFLKLHDDTIWSEIKKLSHFLVTPLLETRIRVKPIQPTSREDQAQIPDYLKVVLNIKYPKECMKTFYFYGKKSAQPRFEMKGGTYERCIFFETY